MLKSNFEDELFVRYLNLLGVKQKYPSLENLRELIRLHALTIPFENISKVFYKKQLNLKGLIDFDLYLDGIEKYGFGGTCYAINFYLNRLLDWLGYQVKLCGADMASPDVHIVTILKIENHEFLVDLGYAAPFSAPIPLDLQNDYSIKVGESHYVVKPRDGAEDSRVELYHRGVLKHGYRINPSSRNIDDFQEIISGSFDESSTFMNTLLITRFVDDCFVTIHNMKVTECCGEEYKSYMIESIDQLAFLIDNRLGIPKNIVLESLSELDMTKGAWD